MPIPITAITGVGEKRAALFARLGVHTLEQLIRLYPRDYLDFSRISVTAAAEGGMCALRVRVMRPPRVAYPRRGLSIVSVTASDETGNVELVWYNQPYMAKNIEQGQVYLVCGRTVREKSRLRMTNPTVLPGDRTPGIVPVYPLTQGLNQSTVRSAMRAAFEQLGEVHDPIAENFLAEYGLAGLNEALRGVHFPTDTAALARARKRLAVEEVVTYITAMELASANVRKAAGVNIPTEGVVEEFCAMLPFAPTNAQKKAMEQVAADLAGGLTMNRMVQGDVGSGKTAVAFFAMYAAAKAGVQSVLMAPTEILARQHYEKAKQLFGGEFSAELLVGGYTAKERSRIYGRLASGECLMVIGTQALLQEKVSFQKLGLVIADEQHRFGVRQRAAIANKADAPHVLVLSATPIPRSLALVLFGDMDSTVIDELPPGRKPVRTMIVPPFKREAMYRYVAQKAALGEQAYVVCPLVEEADEITATSAEGLYEQLRQGALRDTKTELLHGRMSGEQKQAVLERFRRGETSVLISTTVIEVGVDVPNATVMIVESAQRFGLAQLHQLRGRVGRGEKAAECYLCVDREEDAKNERLMALTRWSDGFQIAMQDLEQRGPGAFLGVAQSGMGELSAMTAGGLETMELGQTLAKGIMALPDEREEKQRLVRWVKQLLSSKLKDIALN